VLVLLGKDPAVRNKEYYMARSQLWGKYLDNNSLIVDGVHSWLFEPSHPVFSLNIEFCLVLLTQVQQSWTLL